MQAVPQAAPVLRGLSNEVLDPMQQQIGEESRKDCVKTASAFHQQEVLLSVSIGALQLDMVKECC